MPFWLTKLKITISTDKNGCTYVEIIYLPLTEKLCKYLNQEIMMVDTTNLILWKYFPPPYNEEKN